MAMAHGHGNGPTQQVMVLVQRNERRQYPSLFYQSIKRHKKGNLQLSENNNDNDGMVWYGMGYVMMCK
jgi:hypothetical protein